MNKPISTPLPADLPENWTDTQYVSPGGTEVGLSEKHGYNYQSKQINAAQKAINELNEAFEKVLSLDGSDTMTGKLWLALRYGALEADNLETALQTNNDPGNETTGRAFKVKNSTSEALDRAIQFDDVISNKVVTYLLYGQHNKSLANREILLHGEDSAPGSDLPLEYPQGVHLYLQTPFGALKNTPSEYGLMLSMRHNDEVTQLWFTQAAGTTYRRGGNHVGWASGWTPLADGIAPATIEE